MPLLRALNVDLSSLLLELALLELPMLPRSSGRLGFALPVLDLLNSGFSTSAQCFCRIDLALSVFGKFSFGESSISVLGRVMFGPLLFVQSSTHFGSAVSVLDFIHVDFVLPLRSFVVLLQQFARPELLVSVLGMLCLDLVMLTSETIALGFFSSLHSLCRVASFLLALDFAHLGSLPFLQSLAHLGFSMLSLGVSCLESATFAFDSLHLGFSLSMRCFACLEFGLLVFDHGHLDLSPFLHSLARSDSPFPALTTSRLESSLSTFDLVPLDFSLPTHTSARLGLAVPVSDLLHPESFLLVRSLAHVGPSLSILGLTRLGFFLLLFDHASVAFSMLLHSFAHLGSAPPLLESMHLGLSLPIQSLACSDSSLLVVDSVHSGLLLLVQCLSHTGSSLFVLDLSDHDPPLSPRNSLQLGSMVSLFGLGCVGSVSSLSPVDNVSLGLSFLLRSAAKSEPVALLLGLTHLGLPSPLQSFAWLGLSLLVPDYAHLGSCVLVRQFGLVELVLSVIGKACCGFLLPLLDLTRSEPFLSIRSLACSESTLLVLDAAHLELSTLLQNFQCSDPTAPALGLSCLGFVFLLSLIDAATLGSSLCCVRTDLAMLLLDLNNLGLVMLLRDVAKSDSALFAVGISRLGSCSSLLVIDSNSLDFPMLVRSFACLELLLLALDYMTTGLLVSMQSLVCPGDDLFLVGLSRIGFVFFLLLVDAAHLEPSVLPQHLGRLGSVPLMFDVVEFGLTLPAQSLAWLDLTMSLLTNSRPGLLLFLLDHNLLDPSMFVRSLTCLDVFLSSLELAHFDSLPFAQSLA
eukprot:s4706_g1.t1